MKTATKAWIKGICATVGFGLSTPSSAVITTLTSGVLAALLPGVGGFLGAALGQVALLTIRKGSESLGARLVPAEKQRINHDLQTAFRDACRAGLYDLGGEECFPEVWRKQPRDIPAGLSFPQTATGERLWHAKDPLAGQVADCFQALVAALDAQRMVPLNPVSAESAADVRAYLEAETPQALADAFYYQELAPQLAHFATLCEAVPELPAHLRRHLLDRLLIHLGEALKERDRAWRAYNRLILESLRGEVSQVREGQAEMLARLDELLERPDAQPMTDWTAGLAELISSTGRIEKRLDEGLDEVLERTMAQHAEVVQHLQGLLTVTARIEAKVDRVLRILEDGRYVIEGAPAVALDEPPAPGEPPFKGLQYFEQADERWFFGREQLTARLVGRLRPAGAPGLALLAIVGASGSGKSSLVRAGLLPALARGEPLADGTLPPPGSARWVVHVLTPTAHPLQALAASLMRDLAAVGAVADLTQALARDPHSLDLAARQASARANAPHLLLVVDQFEELFTLCHSDAERQAFVAALLDAAAPETGGGLTLVLTLRADFYAQCAQFERLRQALEQQQAYIGPMNQDELRRAIEEPARRGGWRFERGLVEIILRDVGDEPGALPLLSHALLETWKHRRGHTMTLESYAEAGGVRGAIAKTAETVYTQQLDVNQRALARRLFLRMTEFNEDSQDTRRRVALDELMPSPQEAPDVEAVLQTLTAARLVTLGEGTVEMAHEALIREWPTLHRWLDENRAALRVHRRLTEAAQEWERTRQDEGLLYRGARLAEAGEWAAAEPAALNPLERSFLDASQAYATREAAAREAQRQRELEAAQRLAQAESQRASEQARASRRLRRNALALAAALGVAALFLVIAVVAYQRAQEQGRAALARQLAAQARNHVNDLDLALLLSLEANHLSGTPEVRSSLLAGLVSSPHLSIFLHGHTGWVSSVAFSADGRLLASAGRDSTIILWDSAAQRMLGQPLSTTSPIYGLAFSPDGRFLASGHDDGRVLLWDVASLLKAGSAAQQPRPLPLRGHPERVFGLAFSPDSQWLASASRDKAIILWRVAPQREDTVGAQDRVLKGHLDAVRSVTFSPDGQTLASGSDDGTVILWSVSSGQPLGQPLGTLTTGTTNDDIVAVAFSPDGRTLATAGWDAMINLWDMSTRRQRMRPLQNVDPVPCLAFSPNGRVLAAGGVDATIRLWDADTGEPIGRPLAGHAGWVNGLAFSPDGRWLASGSSDRTVILWDVATKQPPERVLPGHAAPIFSVAFSPDGQTLATGGLDKDIVLWDVATGRPRGQPLTSPIKDPLRDGTNGLAYSSDGRMLAATSMDKILLWDLATRKIFSEPLKGHEGWANAVAVSPDDRYLASGGVDGNVVLWSLSAGQPVSHTLYGRAAPLYSLAVSPDGQMLALGTAVGTISLWDLPGRRFLRQLAVHQDTLNALAFSPDGKLLASAGGDRLIILWDVSSGAAIAQLRGHNGPVNGVAFSPDGQTLASASSDRNVLLWDVISRQPRGQPLKGHTDLVVNVAFSPDGRTLVSSGFDQRILLWDVASGKQLGQFLDGHQDKVWRTTFSPDGTLLASASSDGGVILWDVATRQPLGQPLRGHASVVVSVAFSPDGRLLASSGFDDSVLLWDVATRRPVVGRALTHEGGAWMVAFTPDGRTLLSVGEDGTARLWDVETHQALGEPLVRYSSHTSGVLSVAFSPDNKLLASGSADRTLILWDVASGRPITQPLTGHTGSVRSVAFSPDGRLLASGGLDGMVLLWDVTTGQLQGQPIKRHTGIVMSVAFSSDGRTLASGSCAAAAPDTGYCQQGEIILWDVPSMPPSRSAERTLQPRGQPLTGHKALVFSVAFSPDGRMLASGSWDGTVILWDVATGQPRGDPMLVSGADIFDVAFSADGHQLASVGETQEIFLWDVASGQSIGQPLVGHKDIVLSVAFSPIGHRLASGGADNLLLLWDLSGPQPKGQTLVGHSQPIFSVAFSPDGATLASTSCARTDLGRCTQAEIRLWDTSTGQPRGQPWLGHSDLVKSLAFSRDGKLLASGSLDDSIILWDVASGKPLGQPMLGHDLDIYSVAFSLDGQTLASGGRDGTIILWDVTRRQPRRQPLTGHADTVFSVAFSPDGTLLASASADHSVILWDVASGQPIAPLSDYSGWISKVAFSPDGQTLATGSSDGTLILWDIGPASWQVRACNLVGRNLTRAEWAQYLAGQPYRATCPAWPLDRARQPAQ